MLSNMAFLKFFARPVEAFEPKYAPPIPASSPRSAITSIIPPTLKIMPISPPFGLLNPIPSSTIFAIRIGIIISQITSPIMQSGVSIDGSLNSRSCLSIVLTITILPYISFFSSCIACILSYTLSRRSRSCLTSSLLIPFTMSSSV